MHVRSILAPSAAGAALILGLTLPLAASAQPYPNETIHGTVAQWDGGEHLFIADERGFTDDVALGDQTAIRPAGTQLAVGMQVTIHGYNAGHWFDASTIDIGGGGVEQPVQQPPPQMAPPVQQPPPEQPVTTAPQYQQQQQPPVPPYAYAVPYPVYYPYPAYYPPYPYYYGYGPAVRVNLGFYWGYRGGRWGHYRR
jgi:hypothetical protein